MLRAPTHATDALALEVLQRARRAVEDNARHSACSLYALLCDEFPDATDAQLEHAIERAL